MAKTQAEKVEERRVAAEADRVQKEQQRAEFLKTLPERSLKACALATLVGVNTYIFYNIENKATVRFVLEYNQGSSNEYYSDTVIVDDSIEEYQLANLEHELEERKLKLEQIQKRVDIAKEVYERLTPLERYCVKLNCSTWFTPEKDGEL